MRRTMTIELVTMTKSTLFFEEISDVDPISPNLKQYGQLERIRVPLEIDGDFTGSRYVWGGNGQEILFNPRLQLLQRVQRQVRDLCR